MSMQRGDIDYVLLAALLALVGFGFIMSYSVSSHYTETTGKFSFDRLFFFKRETVRVLGAALALVLAAAVNVRKLRSGIVPLFAASVALLLLTLAIGTTVRGSRSWLFGLQTGELARFTLVLFLARTMAGRENEMKRFSRELVWSLVAVAVVAGTVVLQRDFGSALAIGGVGLVMLLAGGANPLVWTGTVALGAAGFAATALAKPHVMARVRAFWITLTDPAGAAAAAVTAGGHLKNSLNQVHQSLLAIGSGGPLGVGLGQSRQKLLFVPEAHTDFIFSIVAEEGGMVLTLLVMALFLVLLWRGFRIARHLADPFEQLAVVGFTSGIFIYAAINISVAVGLFPVTGLPLPFLSYGGSALLFNVTALGLVLNVSRHRGQQCFQTFTRRVDASADRRWGHRRPSLSRAGGRR
ncbi:MAG: putative lipid II flippase FtsW [Candidatus Edwardsbacteria bacterium]|jgi:cell division protein FtsW|nr:putative lipid II flippase FtsW [Candidatus Edwardsbacteria bacterium]